MNTLFVFALLFAALPDPTSGLTPASERAARLMNVDERAKLATFDLRLQELKFSRPANAFRIASIVVISAAAVLPVGLGAFGLVIGGLAGLLTWNAQLFGSFMLLMFSVVPIWAWVTVGVVAAIGVGMLLASVISDEPRQQQVRGVKEKRRAFIKSANESHRQGQVEVPLTTLLRF